MGADVDVQAKLESLLEAIQAVPDPRRANTEWKQALAQLKKTDSDRNLVDNVVAMRSVERLSELIQSLKVADEPEESEASAAGAEAVDDATCKAAMKLFRRRLKFMRLDEESQINSRSPLTSGRASEVNEVAPPIEFPKEVWAELARRGKLRHTGKGFYELTGQ
jgi:hypothetical protein